MTCLRNHPTASNETRKRILRAVLEEIIVTVEADRLRLVLHWQGGNQRLGGEEGQAPYGAGSEAKGLRLGAVEWAVAV
jgi:hypothetical protein